MEALTVEGPAISLFDGRICSPSFPQCNRDLSVCVVPHRSFFSAVCSFRGCSSAMFFSSWLRVLYISEMFLEMQLHAWVERGVLVSISYAVLRFFLFYMDC